MWLQLGGVYQTSNDLIDHRISDSLIVTLGEDSYVVTTSGPGGGIAMYRIRSDGTLEEGENRTYPPFVADTVSHDLSIVEYGGETIVLFGGTDDMVAGYVLRDDGTMGPVRRIAHDDLIEAYDGSGQGILQALSLFSDMPNGLLPDAPWQEGTVALHELTLDGHDYIITLGENDAQVTTYRIDPNGLISQTGTIGIAEGLGIPAPTALEVITIDGTSFALVASAGASAISVIGIGMSGELTPVQHLIDTGSTYFRDIQDLAVAQSGDHTFVLATGSDHGVTLFRMLPSGQLVFMEAWHDMDGGNLDTPLTVSAEVIDGVLHVTLGAQNAPGLTHFTVDLQDMGRVETASTSRAELLRGGSGHDVLIAGSDNDTLVGGGGNNTLVAGPGRTTMEAGDGVDTFVILGDSTRVDISGFRAGVDRLDLTDLPMLRHVDQLEITSTSSGAVISYRGIELHITSHDGGSLTGAELFPRGLIGPDSQIIVLDEIPNPWEDRPPLDPGQLPAPPPPPRSKPDPDDVPGQYIIGETLRDVLRGGDGDDFIYGGPGRDTIYGGGGNNTIFGGVGRDLIYGSDGGNDLIYGGPGNDRMWGLSGENTIFGGSGNNRFGGGPGDDLLVGGTGNDTIFGGPGNDTLYGGGGNNSLWGMRGDTLIFGGPGNDRIGGGRGDDTIHGGGGNNTIYGGLGNSLIYGGPGDDEIWGMDGDDTIYGGGGNNFIHGGNGDSVIHGGPGDDTLVGGPGADTFIFLFGDETALIRDFTFDDGDRLELEALLWGGGMDAEQVLDRFARVRDGDTIIDFGRGDVITLAGVTDLGTLADYIDII